MSQLLCKQNAFLYILAKLGSGELPQRVSLDHIDYVPTTVEYDEPVMFCVVFVH